MVPMMWKFPTSTTGRHAQVMEKRVTRHFNGTEAGGCQRCVPQNDHFFYGDITERDTMGMGIMFLNLCHVEGIDIWGIPFPASRSPLEPSHFGCVLGSISSFSRCTSNVVHCCSILTGMLRHVLQSSKDTQFNFENPSWIPIS
jgi:hypothetical protein